MRPLVGVDVSALAVKMLELEDAGSGKRRIRAFATTVLPHTPADPDVLAAAMRTTWHRLASRTRDVVMALPATTVRFRQIFLPAQGSEADLEASASLEAQDLTALAHDEISFDYALTGPVDTTQGQPALIAAAPRSAVDARVDIARAAGLRAIGVDLDTLALCSWVMHAWAPPTPTYSEAEHAVACLALDPGQLRGCLLHDGVPQRHDACALVSQPEDALPDLAGEVGQFLRDGLRTHVTQILLGGGLATRPGLAQAITQVTGAQVVLAGAGANRIAASDPSAWCATANDYCIAGGLALRGMEAA